MCAGAIDAILLVVGHPSERVSALMARCADDLVAVDGPAVICLSRPNPI